MHLRFDAPSTMISAPSSPDGPADALRYVQDFVARDRPGGVWLPRFGILAGAVSGFHGLAFLRGGMIAAAPRTPTASWSLQVSKAQPAVALAIFLFERDLVEQLGQHGRVTDIAGGKLSRAGFQCFLVNTDVQLEPDPLLRATMLAGVPHAITLDHDPGAVYQQVQQAVRAAIGYIDIQGLLPPRQVAEVSHGTVQADQSLHALDQRCRQPQRHAEQNLNREAYLRVNSSPDCLLIFLISGSRHRSGRAVAHPSRRARPHRSWRDRTRSSASHGASAPC